MFRSILYKKSTILWVVVLVLGVSNIYLYFQSSNLKVMNDQLILQNDSIMSVKINVEKELKKLELEKGDAEDNDRLTLSTSPGRKKSK
ncbi:MAG TPA: hypothetical protein VIK74_10820 [Parasegetibacter sp.]